MRNTPHSPFPWLRSGTHPLRWSYAGLTLTLPLSHRSQKKVEEGSGGKVKVGNFHNAWQDGLAFGALIQARNCNYDCNLTITITITEQDGLAFGALIQARRTATAPPLSHDYHHH